MYDERPADLPPAVAERDACNAAFYELGLSWFWDAETYDQLARHADSPEARLAYYLRTRQPHLLQAYDAGFLWRAIEPRLAQHRHGAAAPCDWSQMSRPQLGA